MSYALFKNNKINNRNALFIYKVGIFYETYNEDAYVLNYLTNYNIINTNKYDKVGFPICKINAIKRLLIFKNINFIINDKEDFFETENVNNYISVLNLCFDNINKNCLINMIINELQLKDNEYLKQIYFKNRYQ